MHPDEIHTARSDRYRTPENHGAIILPLEAG
jgi:hypothetical protein